MDYLTGLIAKKLEICAKDCKDALQDFLNEPTDTATVARLHECCEAFLSLGTAIEKLAY